jgi:pyridoxamine 5'-phosphate oxidase
VKPDLALKPDPIATFVEWHAAAVTTETPFADAMTLATATPDGKPSARMVLYKGVERGGVCFFTNYGSKKAQELENNPRAALVFFWAPLNRQVRMEGRVERLDAKASDAYFRTRSRESQIGACASPQSQPIAGRQELDERYTEIEHEYAGHDVPRPELWGGYRLVPDSVEFWIGQEHRLHDRHLYEREGAGWRVTRLAP